VSGPAGPTGSGGAAPGTGGSRDTKSGGVAPPSQGTPHARTHAQKRTPVKECARIAHRIVRSRHGNLRKELRKRGCGYLVK
jgi:hypothetical protein